MGDVYQASDTKLNREVAIKVLPEIFAHDAGRMARFEREAKVLASLNHPNIAHIYGVEERALVMELAEGESPKGPLPFDEAWKIAMQIADALEYAHERGVIHRDLKPANVKVTPGGVVKLLDFGLAKAFSDQPDAAGSDPENSPTVTLGATVAGTVLGTAAYMSPEQARGRRVDKRADIWSWGVVLYELLTGVQMFQGEDSAETLAAVIHKQPELERVPPQVRKLLRSCVEKDPKKRLRDIGDARQLLEETASATIHSRSQLARVPALAVFVSICFALAFVAWEYFRQEPTHGAHLYILPPEKGTLLQGLFPSLAVSPDGRRFVFEASVDGKRGLWERDLNNPTPRLLTDFEPGNRPETPFWAPDSRRLAFFQGGQLKRIDVTDGREIAIANPNFRAQGTGSWNQDDVIVFSPLSSPVLWRVPARGGSPTAVTELDQSSNETAHAWPWFLPDGRHFLYLAISTDVTKSAIYVGDLASKSRKRVLAIGTRAIYVNPGYLLYVRDRTLLAQPFDTSRFETTGDAVSVAEQVDVAAGTAGSIGLFSASQNGVLAYTSGDTVDSVQLTWFDHKGKPLNSVGPPGDLSWFSLSPDGASVAFSRRDPRTGLFVIWTWDLAHNSGLRLTSTGHSEFPIWSWNSDRIYFAGNRNGAWKLYQKTTNNTGPEEVVEAAYKRPADASQKYLLTQTPPSNPAGQRIWVVPLSGDGTPSPYPRTPSGENQPRLSPDGRWLAYRSPESGRQEVYVDSFPQSGEKHPISTNGGGMPAWSHDGRELYYLAADGNIMAVEIQLGTHFKYGPPKVLFPARIFTDPNIRFEVSSDGRFLLSAPVEQQASAPMNVVLNWPEMLKKK
jgi:serine/threonine protein kinase/Tol biopolymer transport system component